MQTNYTKVAKNSQIKVGLISADVVGRKMAGPGMRYFELASALACDFSVFLFAPDSCDLSANGFKIITYNSKKSSSDLAKKISDLNVIIAQNLRPPLLSDIKKLKIKFIADLYDPLLIEVLEYAKDDNEKLRNATFDFNYFSLLLQLATADHLLCASDRQRDYYCGILSGRQILNPNFYNNSPNLEKFITIAPFGLLSEKPKAKDPEAFYKKFPAIKKTDKIIYWGGGIWNWFDPISVIKAVEILAKKRDDIKLFFLGAKHPNPKIKKMRMANEAISYAKEKGLIDKFVFFNYDWTPYDERTNYLCQSAIGISTHFDNTETRFSFRTRVLDYFWADLPMILTRGDYFAELCEKRNLGVVVDYKNSKEIAAAAEKIVNDEKFRSEIIKNISEVKKNFYWKSIAENIAKIIKKDRFAERKISRYEFWRLTFHFYKAGLKKKLAK